MANKLVVAPAPHVQTSQSTARIMRDVVIALMPALAVSSVVFGVDVLRVTALSVAACVLFEYLIQKFLVRGASTIGNWSAVVTGVLLAFNLPASIPWWIVLIGAFVAIAIAKMTFGGLGKNPFNPALVGRVFLLIAYPVQMTSFPVPVNGSFDALSGATPLAAVKHGAAADVLGVQELLLGNMPGSLGEVADLRLRLPVVAARHHVADSRDDPRHDGAVRVCRRGGEGRTLGRSGAVAVPVVPCVGRRRAAGCDLHGDGLFDLADDRPGQRDLRRRHRRDYDVHPSLGRLSRRHVVRDPDHERRGAADQQICQTQALRRKIGVTQI